MKIQDVPIDKVKIATASEARHDHKFSEEIIKHLTSLDKVKFCLKYRNPEEVDPTHKLFIDSNYRPAITGQDRAIWSRVNSSDSLSQFQKKNKIRICTKNLSRKLQESSIGCWKATASGLSTG